MRYHTSKRRLGYMQTLSLIYKAVLSWNLGNIIMSFYNVIICSAQRCSTCCCHMSTHDLEVWENNLFFYTFIAVSDAKHALYDCEAWASFLPTAVLDLDSFVRNSLCLLLSAVLTSLYTSNAILSASASQMFSLQQQTDTQSIQTAATVVIQLSYS